MSYKLNLASDNFLVGKDDFGMFAVGDLRESANAVCWAEQKKINQQVRDFFTARGLESRLKEPHGEIGGKHGFISSAKMGDEVFSRIHPEATLIIPSSAWAYAHHVLEGLRRHKGKKVLLSNDSGTWPGIVFMLQLRASLEKLGIPYEIGWGNDLAKPLRELFNTGTINHDTSHVRSFEEVKSAGVMGKQSYYERYKADLRRGQEAAEAIKNKELKMGDRIGGFRMGIFDEFCMGMYAAVIPDELLPLGAEKERLSQSALHARINKVPKEIIERHRRWLINQQMRFVGVKGGLATLISQGTNEEEHLTERQIKRQLGGYDAVTQIADEFGCSVVGVQYQQGLKDLEPASDLYEGMLNCSVRPPVYNAQGKELFKGRPVKHANEVDECQALDADMTDVAWSDLGIEPDCSLHDVRWNTSYEGECLKRKTDVAIWEISGSVPATWNIRKNTEKVYSGSIGERQPLMYFKLGGSTLKGVTKPGEIVWSRIYVKGGKLHMDIGRGGVVQLPPKETQRRLEATTEEWPISHVVTYGVTADQFYAQHKSNHVCMVYAPYKEMANRGLFYKASMAEAMGIEVHICGDLEMTLNDVQDARYREGRENALPYLDRLSDIPYEEAA